MITIHGHPASTCTRKVLMTLGETDTPYELKLVDLAKGEHKQPLHLQRQPFGRIPVLEEGDFRLFESRAIARYLAGRSAGALIPADAQARARVEQWISVETSEFSTHAMKFVYEHVFKRPQEPAVLEAATKALTATLGVMDAQLAQTPYLAGETFTLADVVYMPYIDYVMTTPARALFEPHAHVMAWWKRISERPTWRKVVGRG